MNHGTMKMDGHTEIVLQDLMVQPLVLVAGHLDPGQFQFQLEHSNLLQFQV